MKTVGKEVFLSFIISFVMVAGLYCAYMLSVAVGNASADPLPPCGYYSNLPWSPCASTYPGQHYPGGTWSLNPQPGQMGPGGYEPCTYLRGCKP